MDKKLDSNYTRMLWPILNKSWRQHPTNQQLYSHLPHITKTIQVRQTRHAAHCWRSGNELISNILQWTPSHGQTKAGWPARTYIQQLCADAALKTGQERWTIEMSGERGSGRSVLAARHDDDDIYIRVELGVMAWKGILHSLQLQNWSLTTKCWLISYLRHPNFVGRVLHLYREYSQHILSPANRKKKLAMSTTMFYTRHWHNG